MPESLPTPADPSNFLTQETVSAGKCSVLVVSFPPGRPADGKSLTPLTSGISADFPFHVLLDLDSVDQVQGPFFGELLKLMKLLRGNGGSLKLCQIRQAIHDVLRVTRMERLFEVFPNRAAALASYSPPDDSPVVVDDKADDGAGGASRDGPRG